MLQREITKPREHQGLRWAVVIAALLAAAFGVACLYGLLAMLLMGAIHAGAPGVPALGFWPCTGICALIEALAGGVSYGRD